MSCKTVISMINNHNNSYNYVARLRVVGSQNIPQQGSKFYAIPHQGLARFDGVPDDYYEVGLSIVNDQGVETAIKWEAVVNHTVNVPEPTISAITGTGFTISWPTIASASGYEYQIDNGSWVGTSANTLAITGLSAGKVYSVSVRIVIGMAKGRSATVWAITTPINGNPIYYIERIQSQMLGGAFQSGVNRIVVGNSLKNIGLSYTISQGFVISSAVVDGGSTFASIMQILASKFIILTSHDHASFSVVEFADHAGSGSSSIPELTFSIS